MSNEIDCKDLLAWAKAKWPCGITGWWTWDRLRDDQWFNVLEEGAASKAHSILNICEEYKAHFAQKSEPEYDGKTDDGCCCACGDKRPDAGLSFFCRACFENSGKDGMRDDEETAACRKRIRAWGIATGRWKGVAAPVAEVNVAFGPDKPCLVCGAEGYRAPTEELACGGCWLTVPTKLRQSYDPVQQRANAVHAWAKLEWSSEPAKEYKSVAKKPEPFVCPVCLREGKRRKDSKLCVRCCPTNPPAFASKPATAAQCAVENDWLKTGALMLSEGRAHGEAVVRRALSVMREWPMCCNKPARYVGWSHVRGYEVEVRVSCPVCNSKTTVGAFRMEVRHE